MSKVIAICEKYVVERHIMQIKLKKKKMQSFYQQMK